MNWNALAKTLNITTEIRPVYRAGKRGFLTKDSAMRDAIKGIATTEAMRGVWTHHRDQDAKRRGAIDANQRSKSTQA